jgi:hypothetical protein
MKYNQNQLEGINTLPTGTSLPTYLRLSLLATNGPGFGRE